jgi:hypothetical protein
MWPKLCKIAALTSSDQVSSHKPACGYAALMVEIVKFMHTGVPPVSSAETLEMFEFMDAAQKSREQNGITIKISPQ